MSTSSGSKTKKRKRASCLGALFLFGVDNLKPRNIYLVRHGESEGNADPSVYETTPDYAIRLTAKGVKQALAAGDRIADTLRFDSITTYALYTSTLFRAIDTAQCIEKVLDKTFRIRSIYKEDPRLREQEGNTRMVPRSLAEQEERNKYGTFYYRWANGGESPADVYDRISSFLDSLHRDFEKAYFPDDCVIVTHGMTLRVFLMRWFHMSISDFEYLQNPRNGQVVQLILNTETDKYELAHPLNVRSTLKHDFIREPLDLNAYL